MRPWFLCLLIATLAQAQAPLSRPGLYQVGDFFSRLGVEAGSLEPGPGGAGQSWDFQNVSLRPSDDMSVRFVSPAASPQQASFPGANLVEQRSSAEGQTSQFYQISDSQLVYLGFAVEQNGTTLVVPYQKTNGVLQFPFASGDSLSDTTRSEFISSGIEFLRTGSVTTTADASGSLKLPNASYHQTLRLKTVQEVDQSATVSGLPNHISTTTYTWFSEGFRYPVFTLVQEVQHSDLSSTTVTKAWASEEPRYLPHLATYGGDFTSRLYLRNNGVSAASLSLQAYQSDGSVGPLQSFALAPGQLRVLSHEELGTQTSHLEISGCQACSTTVGYQARSGGGTGHVNQTRTAQEFKIYPAEWDVLFDGMALVNQGQAETSVVATFLDDSGSPLGSPVTLSSSLAPHAKLLVNFSARFGAVRGRVLKVTTSQPSAAIFLRGSLDSKFLFQNQPLQASGPQSRWLAHLSTYGGDFISEVLLHHTGSLSAVAETLTLTPYADGQALASITATLQPNQTQSLSHEALGTSAQLIQISGGSSCVATVTYRAKSGGGTAHLHQSHARAELLAYFGETEVLWDGLALVNLEGQAATYRAQVLDAVGTTLFEANLGTRLENEKLLRNLSTLFQGQNGLTFRIQGDRDSAMLLLRGSLGGRFLFPNQPL